MLGQRVIITAAYDTVNPDRVIARGVVAELSATHLKLEGRDIKFPRGAVCVEVVKNGDTDGLRRNTLPASNVPTPNGIRKKRSRKTRCSFEMKEGYVHYSRLECGIF